MGLSAEVVAPVSEDVADSAEIVVDSADVPDSEDVVDSEEIADEVADSADSELKSYPPKEGDFAYFDSRMKTSSAPEWIVNVEGRGGGFGCHYSKKTPPSEEMDHITCHGKIKHVVRFSRRHSLRVRNDSRLMRLMQLQRAVNYN
jgi:hypothetical protein